MTLPPIWAKLILAACLTVATMAGHTQTYPTKPIKLLVGFPPGGGTDVLARSLAMDLSKALGQQVIVENRGGANGVIATSELARSPADGYTLMMTISSHVTNALLYPKLSYELKDFQPISLVATSPFVLLAHPSFPANNIKELVALAKSKSKGVDFGSPGAGSTQHLSMELMNVMAGVQMTHIPYKGGAPALNDLLAGQVPLMFLTTVQSLPFLKDKRVKAIAVSTANRTPVLRDVPTIAEAGVPGYESDVWFGVIAPGGTPKVVVDRLHAEIVRIIKTPEMQKNLATQGAEPVGNTPEQFGALIMAEHAKWADLIKRTGIKAE